MITGIEHTGLVARDTEKICEFYEKYFGCEVIMTYPNGTKFLKCHNGIIEVYPMKSDDETVCDNYVKGLRHLAFETDDFNAAHKLHEEMGCICYENEAMGIYFITDPDGYWLEVVPARK